GLEWLPAEEHGRLRSLASLIVPYRSDRTVERGIAMTRDALNGIVRLARARGATPLVVVPYFGVESEADRSLRQRVLDDGSVPYVLVAIDEGRRLSWDRHPNARAASDIALAVVERLRQPQ